MSIWEVDKLLIFIGFVIPGFISIKVFDLLHPSESIDSTKKVIEAVTYSCFNYALLFIPMYFTETMEVKNNSPILYGLFYLFVLLIFPVLISFAISKIRQCDFVQKKSTASNKNALGFCF